MPAPDDCLASVDDKAVSRQEDRSTPRALPTSLYAMILVGAALSTPKSRLILELENFDVRPFGWRDDDKSKGQANNASETDDEVDELADDIADISLTSTTDMSDENSEEEDSFAETSFASTAETDELEEGEETSVDQSTDDEDEEEDEIDELEDDCDVDQLEEDLEAHEDEYDMLSATATDSTFENISRTSHESSTIQRTNPPPAPSTTLDPPALSLSPPTPTTKPPSPPATVSTNQQGPNRPLSPLSSSSPSSLLAVERLIYRILSAPPLPSSTSDDDEEELPLSQTTLLIRAPRRFKHDSFLPRQTHSRELNAALDEYLSPPPPKEVKGRKGGGMLSKKVGSSGLKVSCQRTSDNTKYDGKEEILVAQSQEEDEDMIWWQWSGKLKGIGDELFSF